MIKTKADSFLFIYSRHWKLGTGNWLIIGNSLDHQRCGQELAAGFNVTSRSCGYTEKALDEASKETVQNYFP